VIDVDLKSYFDTIRHHILLNKIAKRVKDRDILRLIKLILRANGKQGVSQGGPISPLFSNIYLNDVDEMLEKAKEVTTKDGYQHMEYARWADDIVITVDGHSNWEWLRKGLYERFSEEMAKIEVSINHDKTKQIDLAKGGKINFLGFDFRRYKTIRNKFGILRTPKMEARTNLLGKLKDVFKRYKSQPLDRVIEKINPILRGWVNYFRIGNSARCFNYVKDWVYKKARRHLMKARKRKGFGWQRWSREWIYQTFNLYEDYKIRYYQ
jgi:RNA-directed DNA polymerase